LGDRKKETVDEIISSFGAHLAVNCNLDFLTVSHGNHTAVLPALNQDLLIKLFEIMNLSYQFTEK
jgi:hypothetical protein